MLWQGLKPVIVMAGAAALMGAQESAPPEPEYIEESFAGEEEHMEHARPAAPARVNSARDAARLRGLQGISLQWISWDQRGDVGVTIDEAGVWRLYGEQFGPNYQAVVVDGTITEIGADYFTLEGAITIANAPEEGRTCEGYGSWRFAVTQNRKYYRLREFEWCDDLTDYIDLYF